MSQEKASSCCTPDWTDGVIDTAAGKIHRVRSVLNKEDKIGMLKCRISNKFRMSYRVGPGIYAYGNPTADSPVFVTANYKLTFDVLRRDLGGLDSWILALDTKGINVWCAAGKGTFGTGEVIRQVQQEKLDKIVSHKRLILPQFGAPGVQAHVVLKETGFGVRYGPLHANDIPAYAANGFKATREMRTVEFPFMDRLELTPMELVPAMRKFAWIILSLLVVFGLQPKGILFTDAIIDATPHILLTFLAIVSGAFLVPTLLPFVPFRAFAAKGWFLTLILVGCAAFIGRRYLSLPELVGAMAVYPALGSYLAFNFTGCTPFTSISGVKKELKVAIPLYFAASGVALAALVYYKLLVWGIIR